MTDFPENQDPSVGPQRRESIVDPHSQTAAALPLESSPEELAEKTKRDAEAQEAAREAGHSN